MQRNINLEPTAELNEAFADFQSKVVQPKKTHKGHFGSYADLADINASIQAVAPLLGLSYQQEVVTDIDVNGKRMSQVITHIRHKSGESIAVEGLPVDIGTTPQQMLANNTYARRGSLANAFGLVADEDDDGEQISAVRQEQLKQDEVRKAIIARLKEKLKKVPKEKIDQVFATAGLNTHSNTDNALNKLSANTASLLAGAAIYSINDAGLE